MGLLRRAIFVPLEAGHLVGGRACGDVCHVDDGLPSLEAICALDVRGHLCGSHSLLRAGNWSRVPRGKPLDQAPGDRPISAFRARQAGDHGVTGGLVCEVSGGDRKFVERICHSKFAARSAFDVNPFRMGHGNRCWFGGGWSDRTFCYRHALVLSLADGGDRRGLVCIHGLPKSKPDESSQGLPGSLRTYGGCGASTGSCNRSLWEWWPDRSGIRQWGSEADEFP